MISLRQGGRSCLYQIRLAVVALRSSGAFRHETETYAPDLASCDTHFSSENTVFGEFDRMCLHLPQHRTTAYINFNRRDHVSHPSNHREIVTSCIEDAVMHEDFERLARVLIVGSGHHDGTHDAVL